jgi:hypothetical protein
MPTKLTQDQPTGTPGHAETHYSEDANVAERRLLRHSDGLARHPPRDSDTRRILEHWVQVLGKAAMRGTERSVFETGSEQEQGGNAGDRKVSI